jgi:hypothetical protein
MECAVILTLLSAPVRTGRRAYPTSYTMGAGLFLGKKRPEGDINHPPPSVAEVKERVELHLYSPTLPTWLIVEWILPCIFTMLTLPSLHAVSEWHCAVWLHLAVVTVRSRIVVMCYVLYCCGAHTKCPFHYMKSLRRTVHSCIHKWQEQIIRDHFIFLDL